MSKKTDPEVPHEYHATIFYGPNATAINRDLLKKQGVEHNLELIKGLHYNRMMIEDAMRTMPEYYELVTIWTYIQFDLQEAWGFPEDSKFHRFWTVPGCKCPKLDNEDMYPTGVYAVSGDCTWHGKG